MSLLGTLEDREYDKFVFDPIRGHVVKVDTGASTTGSIAAQILSANDRTRVFTWLDFNKKTERVSTIVYTAPSVSAQVLTQTFSYTLVNGAYRLDQDVFTLV